MKQHIINTIFAVYIILLTILCIKAENRSIERDVEMINFIHGNTKQISQILNVLEQLTEPIN